MLKEGMERILSEKDPMLLVDSIVVKHLLDDPGILARKMLKTPQPDDVKTLKDIRYANDSEEQTLDIHVPDISGPLPVMIYIHGGGWISGDKDNYDHLCFHLARQGLLVCNVNYRLGPKHHHPTQLSDVCKAISWIAEHAREHGGDASRVFLGGESAGAHLASLIACICTNEDLDRSYHDIPAPLKAEQLNGLVLFYGAYDLSQLKETHFPGIRGMLYGYLGMKDPNEYEHLDMLSPLKHVTPRFPATFICSGGCDQLHPQTLDMIQEMETNGVPCAFLLFAKARLDAYHGFIGFPHAKSTRQTLAEMDIFLKNHTSG